MRKTTMYLIGASLAASAALAPTTLSAQDDLPGEEVSLTAEQQAEYDGWPPDMQSAYMTWPNETKGYYWSLTPERQGLFWRLSDDDKLALTAMTGPERDTAWQNIEARASGGSAEPPTEEPAAPEDQ
ncbi:hypothetical protein [Erythrobacter sp. JK5]|uniref:hypothetical protein n=1 Tax=Erythrobacter sp. JK5 TaxID=2829500 RepID=UPI001BADBF61|nr:hypothetical protein [Erythrobacter sp. JK5]QUL38463.1 hypothetical protein KDC96_03400 [Erythrobacter sp. JK5]